MLYFENKNINIDEYNQPSKQQFLLLIQMETFRSVCQIVNQLATVNQSIATAKLSLEQVQTLFSFIDVRRKGYLDVSDILELVGDVTEDELFRIFKYLDASRTGEIRVSELQLTLGNKSLKTNNPAKQYLFPRFYKIVDTVKDKPVLINQFKQKYECSQRHLKDLYQLICKNQSSSYLTFHDLIDAFKRESQNNDIRWLNQSPESVVEILQDHNITEMSFCKAFTLETQSISKSNQLGENQSAYNRMSKDQSNLPTKYQQPSFQISKQIRSKIYEKTDDPKTYVKTNNFFKVQTSDPIFSRFSQEDSIKNRQYESNLNDNQIDTVFVNIQRRREQLKRDSLERKKIIDEVLQRKKEICGVQSHYNPTSKFNAWQQKIDQFCKPSTQSNLKKSTKTYLNQTSSSAFQQKNDQIIAQQPLFHRSPKNYIPERSLNRNYNLQPQQEFVTKQQLFGHKYQAEQIIQKYIKKQNNYQPQVSLSPKSILSKSKSGFIYNQAVNQQQFWNQQVPNKTSKLTYSTSNSRLNHTTSSKQNILRRAEEEATRKIEQIERKARLKVMERKQSHRPREELQFGSKLVKRGFYC